MILAFLYLRVCVCIYTYMHNICRYTCTNYLIDTVSDKARLEQGSHLPRSLMVPFREIPNRTDSTRLPDACEQHRAPTRGVEILTRTPPSYSNDLRLYPNTSSPPFRFHQCSTACIQMQSRSYKAPAYRHIGLTEERLE